MCGGHNSGAPGGGVTRSVRTIGEIEPCKLEVKAQAPIRKFAAMRELVGKNSIGFPPILQLWWHAYKSLAMLLVLVGYILLCGAVVC
jgi:hypothetical protein